MTSTINSVEVKALHRTPALARSRERLTKAMAPTIYCPSAHVERCVRSKVQMEHQE